MAEKITPFFPHRQNRDGSFDSVCMNCLAVVSSARAVTDLRSYATQHVCAQRISPKKTTRSAPLDQVPASPAERSAGHQAPSRGPVPRTLKWPSLQQLRDAKPILKRSQIVGPAS